jgi:hypothetical protein
MILEVRKPQSRKTAKRKKMKLKFKINNKEKLTMSFNELKIDLKTVSWIQTTTLI